MNLQLDDYIYRWLFTLNIIPAQVRKLKNTKIEIPLTVTSSLANGALLLKILQAIINKKSINQKLPPPIALKNHSTPSDRLYNWSLLSEVLKSLGFNLDLEVKRLIVTGDTPILNEFLKQLHQFFNESIDLKEQKTKSNQDITVLINNTSLSKSLITNESLLKDKALTNLKESIDLSTIDINKPLDQTDSLLEFLIVGLSKNLNLKPTQTIALFTKNTKYLAHVISKGVKGEFDPIIGFMSNVAQNLETLLHHLDSEETQQYLTSFLQIIKPSLVSKNREVAQQGLKIYRILCEELYEKKLMTPAWDWFTSLNGGLNTAILCMKRHPDLIQETVEFLKEIGKLNLLELFTVLLKNNINDDKHYLYIITRLFEPMVGSIPEDELLTSGILDKWIELALQIADSPSSPDIKIEAFSFLTEVWLLFPHLFESEEAKAMSIINTYKKACKNSQAIAFICIVSLFRLLENFGQNKDPYAPIIYKTLTFILIENANAIEIRTLIMHNMIQILSDLESIPLSIIIEPWVKQIQVSSNNSDPYVWNIIDFEFMKFLAIQEKLTIKNAIQILDLLSKTFLNDHVYSQFSIDIMLIIINKFLNNEILQEFLSKLIKISLAIYFAAEKKLKSKKNKDKIKVSKPNPSEIEFSDQDLSTIASQKNALIVKFLKNLAEMKDEKFNDKLKPLVAHTNLQLKKILNVKTNDKGMINILSLWGNPDKISAKYESEYYDSIAREKLKKREEDLKYQIKSGLDTTGNISQISATSVREIVDHHLNNISGSFEQKSGENPIDTNHTMPITEYKGGDIANAGNNFEKGLRAQGIGYKNPLEKSTLSKAEQVKMALLRNPKADPKILTQLKELAQTHKDKNQSMMEEFDQQKSFVEKQKITLRKQLEKRAIEQGIAHKNLKDIETNLIFPLDSREVDISKEKKHGLFEMELINMLNEEERDNRFVESFFRTNNKLLKYLFVKYANLSVRKTKPDTFDKLTLLSQRMTAAELWKLLKDFNYTGYVSQDKVESMIRLINIHIFKEKDEKLKSLDFDGFLIFLLNLAYWVYSKDPPGDLRHLPPNFSLEGMIQHFREVEKNRGVSTILFDDPEATIVADSEVLKEFNRKLEEDPEYVLPEGYKKIPDIRVKFEYKLYEGLTEALPESYSTCYDLLNDILNEQLGFYLYEPQSNVTQIYLARPKILNPVASKVFNNINQKNVENNNVSAITNSSPQLKINGSPTLNKSFAIQPRKKVLEIAHKQPLSFNMKLEIAKFDPKYKYMAEEIGYLLEDVLCSVEKGMTELPKYQKIMNRVIENKTRDQSLEQEMKEKKEQKRIMRHNLLKQEMKEKGLLPESESQRKEMMKKRYEDTKKPSEQENEAYKKKKLEEWEKRMKKHEGEKKKTQEDKKKKVEEEIQKKSDDQKMKEQEVNDKKKQFLEFNKKAKDKLKNKFEEIIKIRKETIETKEKQPDVQKAKVKAFNEKILPKMLEKSTEQIKKDKEFNELLKQKLNSEEFQQFFQKQEPTFKALFTYLLNQSNIPLSALGKSEAVPLKTLLAFANEFELCPLLTNFNEIITSYNNMTKGKPIIDGLPIGINYQEFLEILFKVAAKSHHILNKISEYMKISGSLNEDEIEKINQGNAEEEKQEIDNNVTMKNEVNQLTKLTMNGLLFYMGLPIDPQNKEEVVNCIRKKLMKKEIKSNKKKKLDLQKKLEGEGYESPLLTVKKSSKSKMSTHTKFNENEIKYEGIIQEVKDVKLEETGNFENNTNSEIK